MLHASPSTITTIIIHHFFIFLLLLLLCVILWAQKDDRECVRVIYILWFDIAFFVYVYICGFFLGTVYIDSFILFVLLPLSLSLSLSLFLSLSL